MADLECYLAARLLWNPYQDENGIIDDFIKGVYGEECYPYIRKYVDTLCDSLNGNTLTISQNSDAGYFTDSLIQNAEELFGHAFSVVKSEKSKWYLQKEYLSILFMKASRMAFDDPERSRLIDQLYEDVRRFNITEIRERRNLEVSFDILRKYRYAESRENEYSLYYIMK